MCLPQWWCKQVCYAEWNHGCYEEDSGQTMKDCSILFWKVSSHWPDYVTVILNTSLLSCLLTSVCFTLAIKRKRWYFLSLCGNLFDWQMNSDRFSKRASLLHMLLYCNRWFGGGRLNGWLNDWMNYTLSLLSNIFAIPISAWTLLHLIRFMSSTYRGNF